MRLHSPQAATSPSCVNAQRWATAEWHMRTSEASLVYGPAALVLATDTPTDQILDRKPAPKSAPLITIRMWKMIIGQAIYQLVVTMVLYFAGTSILGYDTHANPKLQDDHGLQYLRLDANIQPVQQP